MAALAEDSSTMALLVANAATRAWTARLYLGEILEKNLL